MKKKILNTFITSLVIITILLTAGCNTQNDDFDSSNNPDLDNKPAFDFSQEYESIINSISIMNEESDFIVSIVLTVWQEAGADEAGMCLAEMLSVSSEDDCLFMSTTSLYNIIDAFGIDDSASWSYQCNHGGDYATNLQKFGVLSEIYAYCETYSEKYSNVTSYKAEIKETIKKLDENSDDEHSDAIDALEEYYLKSCSYADFALEPSGSLINYSSSCMDYTNELSELKTKAEFEK